MSPKDQKRVKKRRKTSQNKPKGDLKRAKTTQIKTKRDKKKT